MPAATDLDLLDRVVVLCEQAGAAIMAVYGRADFHITQKEDESPVTAADLAAHHLLVPGLKALLDLPVLSEEAEIPNYTTRSRWQRYWLVDPLDGTREFISRNGEFTVNVALIEEGYPVLGVVHAPVLERTYTGVKGIGAHRRDDKGVAPIHTRSLEQHLASGKPLRAVLSRRHGLEQVNALVRRLEEGLGPIASTHIGSSLKFCLIAEGTADIYPRPGPTSEWDTAAAQAVVEAAGGEVLDASLQPMRYNGKESLRNSAFYVIGDRGYNWRALLPLAE